MKLRNLQEVELALRPYVPLVMRLTGGDTTLERIQPLMTVLGNPEQRLKIIHVAGTSGKTSTSYYISAMLTAAGKKVCLTVSPHVDSITERVQVNGQPLSIKVFCSELGIFLDLIKKAEQAPSYFELLYAFALWVFDRQAVDYAVIETGMGGLHDATNVAQRPDKICVITDIGYDHMHILGHTLPLIAAQKIGIVHSGNTVICYIQTPEVMEVFKAYTVQHGGTLLMTSQLKEQADYGADTSTMPLYQQRNWLLARRVYMQVAARDGLAVLKASDWLGTQRLQVPARMEIIEQNGKTLVMDGAHNQQKMAAFVASFKQRYPNVRPVVMVTLKTGKEYEAVSPMLADLASEIIVTTFDTSQDLPARSMDPEEFADALRNAGAGHVTVVPDQRLAYDTLMNKGEPIRVITGSFYLLSQLRGSKIV